MLRVRDMERPKVMMQVEGGLVSPAGDGVVGDGDIKGRCHNIDDVACGERLKDGEVEGKGDDGL